ncbi:hypothetical protein M514_11108 [Trichuris suis]|uniref:Uncharacterized protein n=1 Tax=Trichuris suis TaxID=68888 RepID=A0A085LST0_9BILA|nr:hypothetical protein M513_11108 [Trichuris suis]KFD68829.1 hypothetical protein M514_11108 [Trichuris suis]
MDFSEHFWGDKHNGFAVMYQIMKGGQQTVKDLFDLIKERAGVEDDNHRHGAKTVKLICNFDNHSSLNPLWCTLKSYFQKLLDVQQGFVIRLLELSKEVQRFGDDQFKIHKSVKEKESKTFEAVNLIQTTTTCLQKAKELYHTRCLELEKMKRDNCSLKELNKMQVRLEKARRAASVLYLLAHIFSSGEEYRHYVDKYENVRVDFEERLTAAAKNFQSLQLNHFEQMKKFLTTYMCSVSSYYQSLLSLSQETNAEIHNVDVTALLAELVTTRGTGAERPVRVKFEEPQCASTHNLFPSSSSETPIGETVASADSPIHLDGIPFDIDQSNAGRRGANMFAPSNSRERSSCTSSLSSTNSSPMTSTANEHLADKAMLNSYIVEKCLDFRRMGCYLSHQISVPSISTSHSKTKLNLWLPGRRSSCKSSSSTRKDDGSSPAGTKLRVPNSGDSSVNVKQQDCDSKAAWTNPLFEGSFNSPSQKDLDAVVAASSDACQDSNRKRTLSIGFLKRISKDRKKGPDPNHSCELKDDDEPNSICSVATPVNSAEHCLRRSSLPEHSNSSDSESGNEELDKKINIQIKPLMCDAVSGSASVDELREAIGSMTFTPTVVQQIVSICFLTESELKSSHTASSQGNDADHPSRLFSASQEPSLSLHVLQEKIPIAVAIIETVHALFKIDGDCIVKVFGSVTVSFPSGCLRLLKHDASAYPLVFSLKNVTRMHSVVYNQKLMSRSIQIFNSLSLYTTVLLLLLLLLLFRVPSQSDSCHKYEFNMTTLLNELQEHACRTPVAPYYNLEVMRYEVQTEPSVNAPDQMAPLLLKGSWNRKDDNVHLCIRYGYNPQCCLCSPLSNVVFITDVCGNVQSVECNSDMSWSHEENRLQFNLTEMSCHRSSSGILRATVHCTSDNEAYCICGLTQRRIMALEMMSEENPRRPIHDPSSSHHRGSIFRRGLSADQNRHVFEADDVVGTTEAAVIFLVISQLTESLL